MMKLPNAWRAKDLRRFPRFVKEGDQANAARQWPKAALAYQQALRINPAADAIWVQYGHALKEQGFLADAEKAYRSAIEIDATKADTHLQLGHVLKLQGETNRAIAAYELANRLDPTLHPAMQELRAMRASSPTMPVAIGNSPAPVIDPSRTGPNDVTIDMSFLQAVRDNPNSPDAQAWHLFFDHHWYGQFAPELHSREDLLEHYMTKGWRAGHSPSPYLNVTWYYTRVLGPLAGLIEPIQHFVQEGAKDMQSTHPLFNMKWYKWTYNPAEYSENMLANYLVKGWKNSSNPHPLFWGDWYRKKYLKSLENVNPFYHYLTEGARKRLDPNPLFDAGWYAAQARLSDTDDALLHYILGGNLHFNPHPLFDATYFRKNLPAGYLEEASPLELYLTSYSDINPCPLLDVPFFLSNLARAGYNDRQEYPALVRYVEMSTDRLVDPHPFFSTKFYLDNAPDVRQARLRPLQHYVTSGWTEDRQPHPLFNARHYRETCPDSYNRNPLLHYLQEGYARGFAPRASHPPDQRPKPLPSGRRVLEIPSDVPLLSDGKPSRGRIGVFAHIFYPQLAEEMLKYVNNIPSPCTVYITTTTYTNAIQIEEICSTVLRHAWVVRVVPNRGRDVAPTLTSLRAAADECEYGIHIHSKRSLHYAEEFETWRKHLLEENLGTPELISNILSLLALPNVGAFAPEHYAPIKPLIQWGGNFQVVRDLLWLMGENLSAEHTLDFPSGSMFWFKIAALRKLLDLELTPQHFDPEAGQVDGTLAHAIERGFFYFVEAAGFEWVVGRSVQGRSTPFPSLASADIKYWTNRILPTNRELGNERKYFGECTAFVLQPSIVRKPRLNLLIPVVETGKAYAGVSTAIDVFNALRRELGAGFDARMIATDVSPSNQFAPPSGYAISSPREQDVEGCDTVVDGAQRYRFPMFVRENDIFLATAWWTARSAFDMLRQQEKLFGHKRRKVAYLIQDFECGFYAWSTKYAFAEQTYMRSNETIPIFNTDLLRQFFLDRGYYDDGFVLEPPINPSIRRYVVQQTAKEKIVLLYARPHADRNCLSFLDMLIDTLVQADPEFWHSWRFCAIGEDFGREHFRCSDRIDVLGRLTLAQYGALASRAALGISLMVSPHPSYPPLEMADAGVLTLTNTYGSKDLAAMHENIESFTGFHVGDVASQLVGMARRWTEHPDIGWQGKPKVDWFFGGKSNLDTMVRALATEVSALERTNEEENPPDRQHE